MNAWFVTGTDTGVGKTLVTAAMLHVVRRQGRTAAGMKPVAAGCEFVGGTWRNEDVEILRAASSPGADGPDTHPYVLRAAIAPHIAAEQEGITIEPDRLVRAFEALRARADVVVVEGAGGWLVPLDDSTTLADLATTLRLPVVLVVGMRLGCLNHALLTREAIRSRGLAFAGWVANRIDPGMPAYAENLASLRSRLDAPMLGEIPHLAAPDPARIEISLPG